MKTTPVSALRERLGFSTGARQEKPVAARDFKPRVASELEENFSDRWRALYPQLPFEREFVFLPERRFRLDFAWPDQKIGLEIHGATHVKGAHSTGTGLARDYEKLNLAQNAGWIVLQFDSAMSREPQWLAMLALLIERRAAKESTNDL